MCDMCNVTVSISDHNEVSNQIQRRTITVLLIISPKI